MSVTPACRLPTSIDKRRQLVVVVCGGHTQVHFNRDLYLLGRPTVTSCHLHLQLDLISDFRELSVEIQEIQKIFSFAVLHWSSKKQTIAKIKFKRPNAFSDLKSGFKKK